MNSFVNKIDGFLFLFVPLLLCGSICFPLDLSPDEMGEIIKISKTIGLAKPNLPDSKKLEYAVGIFKASTEFKISSNLLIAIAAQETSFREDLPEGRAGEFGIVQIRKNWMNNKKFRKHFKKAKTKDLLNPEKAFLYAAWILRDLRDNSPKSSIPFWSFYNARGFQPRFRYFLSVNQKLSYLNKGVAFTRDVADNVQTNGSAEHRFWQPDVRLIAEAPKINIEIPSAKAFEKNHSPNNLITTASLGSEVVIQNTSWVKQALKRIEKETVQLKLKATNAPVTGQIDNPRRSRRLAFTKSAAKLLKSVSD